MDIGDWKTTLGSVTQCDTLSISIYKILLEKFELFDVEQYYLHQIYSILIQANTIRSKEFYIFFLPW